MDIFIKRQSTLCILLFYLFLGTSAHADWNRPWGVSLSAGIGSRDPLQKFVQVDQPELGPGSKISLGVTRTLPFEIASLRTELDFQASNHLKPSTLFELSLAPTVRWKNVPWRKVLESSFGFGNGVSISNRSIPIESVGTTPGPRLLYYVFFDFQFSVEKNLLLFLRVNHRSGVFGLLSDLDFGSNFLNLGLQIRI